MKKTVSIITINFNQNDYTLKCIKSILNSNFDDFKLILIDNGSSFKNYKKLLYSLPKSNLYEVYRIERNRGYVGGINYGLKIAKKLDSEYILVMNNDTIIDCDAIEELVEECKNNNNKAIVSGKIYHYSQPNLIQDVGFKFYNKRGLKGIRLGENEEDIGQFDEVEERDLLDDIFWMFPSKLYDEIGGYSNYFWFNAEQADFALRAKQLGYKLVYTPKSKIWHKGSVSIGGRDKNPKLAYWHTQSTLIFRYLHLSRHDFLIQYLKLVMSIISSYFTEFKNAIKGENVNINYPNAKLKGLFYFNKWILVKNKNNGFNPYA